MANGDFGGRVETRSVGPVIEGGETIAAGIRRGEGRDGAAAEAQSDGLDVEVVANRERPTGKLDEYRKIQVKVNRPNVTVLFRDGYYARAEPSALDRRRMLAYVRIVDALNATSAIPDIEFQATASLVTAGKTREMQVDVLLQPSHVPMEKHSGGSHAELNLGVFCLDARQNVVGQLWQTLDFSVRDDGVPLERKNAYPYRAKLPVKGTPKSVRVVIYQYDADMVGSQIVTMEKVEKAK